MTCGAGTANRVDLAVVCHRALRPLLEQRAAEHPQTLRKATVTFVESGSGRGHVSRSADTVQRHDCAPPLPLLPIVHWQVEEDTELSVDCVVIGSVSERRRPSGHANDAAVGPP